MRAATETLVPDSFPCPMCGHISSFACEAKDENRRISDVTFRYFRCDKCMTLFLGAPPSDIGRYYQGDYYSIPSLEQLAAVADKDRNKISTVLSFKKTGTLLEVGPAFGVFAWQAKQAGFKVRVIEMDARCCDYLRQSVGVDVVQSDHPENAIAALPPHDVIALWHVMEHLPAPMSFLRLAAENLAADGILVIAMPNPDSFQFRIMGHRWPHLDAPRHLALIPHAILRKKAEDCGLEQVYFTNDDSDARSWNRFGWQRLLMNKFSSKFLQRLMFLLGYVLSGLLSPLDRRDREGSAYTVVFRKKLFP